MNIKKLYLLRTMLVLHLRFLYSWKTM